MFSSLHVKNFILIDDLTIDFQNNMTVLTGETGAGKSLIIDATKFLLGSRIKSSVIKEGSQKAIVEGVFNNYSKVVSNLLEEFGIDEDEDLILRREINLSGKSTYRINGSIVTLSQLEKISDYLMDIHVQHDTKKLFDSRSYFEFIDDEEILACLNEYTELRKVYLNCLKDYNELIN